MSDRRKAAGWVAVVEGLVVGACVGASSAALAQEPSANESLRELAKPGLRWGVLSEKDLVPPEEREALGLENADWTLKFGKVHPSVYKSLEKAEHITEPWLDVSGHTGTVYVQVQLKHEQRGKRDSGENKRAMRQVQTEVLSQLTACEFYSEFEFQTLPAFLGYATRAAVRKLATNPNVLAVCLDEKPLPRRTGRVASQDLPLPEEGKAERGDRDRKVHPDVHRALALMERVFVVVPLKHATSRGQPEPQTGAARNVEEAVLSALDADQFWLVWRSPIGSGRSPEVKGLVNSSGLKVLQGHPLVEWVMLDQRLDSDLEPVVKQP